MKIVSARRRISALLAGTFAATLLVVPMVASPAAAATTDYVMDFYGPGDSANTVGRNALQVIPSSTSSAYTVEAWIKVDTNTGGWQSIAVQNQSTAGSANRMYFGLSPSLVPHMGVDFDQSTIINGTNAIPLGVWKHMAVTVPAGTSVTAKIYVDGAEVASKSITRTTTNAGTGFSIGTANDGIYRFDGQIDQVKVWNGALTPAQIVQSKYSYSNENLTGTVPSLRAHYDFNDSSATTTISDKVAGNTYYLSLNKERSNFVAATRPPYVAFDAKGGSAVGGHPYTIGGTIAAPTTPTRTGYTLSGWSNTDGGSNVSFPYSPFDKTNLVARYEVGDGTSYNSSTASIADTSGQSSGSATIVGAPPFTSGTENGNLDFDGSTQYVVTPNLRTKFTGTTYSLFAWVKPQETDGVIISELGTSTPNVDYHTTLIEMVGGKFRFTAWPVTQSSWIETTNTFTQGNWYLVGITYDSSTSTFKGYAYDSSAGLMATNVSSLTFTRERSATGQHFGFGALEGTNMASLGSAGNFQLASFYAYNSAISAATITRNYQATCLVFHTVSSVCNGPTLYANWNINNYTISYSGGSGSTGSAPSSPVSVAHGSTFTVPNNTYSKIGYAFTGWSDGTNTYAPGSTYPSVTANVPLTATWAVPISAPGPASGSSDSITATAGLNSIDVAWSAPAELNNQTITGYKVEYATSASPNSWTVASSSIAANATSYSITDLNSSTAYYVRVAALTAYSQGTYGYPWTKVYSTSRPYRTASSNTGAITYDSGFGLGAGDAQATYSSAAFSRVRYKMSATYSSQAKYVDADFAKSVTNTPAYISSYSRDLNNVTNLRVPAPSGTDSQFVVQGDVADLNVLSNVSAVTDGNGFAGRLELFPMDYGYTVPSEYSGTQRGSTSQYDDADTASTTGIYGSFQLHNMSAGFKQTDFAWNRHYDSTFYEIGFGDNGSPHPDWTFCKDTSSCPSRTLFNLSTYINTTVTPYNAYSITLAAGSNGTGDNQTLSKTHGADLTLPDSATANSYFTRSGYVVAGWSTVSAGTSKTYELGGSYTTNSTATIYPYWEAELKAYESFNNAGASLTGFSGGSGASGFTGNWLGVNSVNYLGTASVTLKGSSADTWFRQNYPPGIGFSYSASNYSAGLGGGSNLFKQNARELTTSVSMDTNRTYYASYLLMNAVDSNQMMVNLLTGVPSSTTDTSKNALSFGYVPDAGPKGQWAIDYGSANRDAACPDSAASTCTSTAAYSAVSTVSGGVDAYTLSGTNSRYPHLVLVKITANSSGNDTVSLKGFNYGSTIPMDDSAISWDVTYTGAITGSFTHMGAQMYASGYQYVDEIRLGNTYSSVVNPTTTKTLTLEPNYVGGSSTTQIVSTSVATQVANPFTRAGFTFNGWNTNADGTSGTNYTTSQLVTASADTTLYAKWTPITYTMTLAAGTGGSGSTVTATKSYNVDYTLPNSTTANSYFTKANYTITGWATTDGGALAYALGATYSSNAALTFYPVWTPMPVFNYSASDIDSYEYPGNSVADLSSNLINATVYGSLTYDSSSYGWSFPGGGSSSGPYIDVADFDSSRISSGLTFDFEADFGTNQTNPVVDDDSFERILDFGESGALNDNVLIGREWVTNNLFIEIFTGANGLRCVFTNSISEGVMTRYTATVDGTNCKLYKNGATTANDSKSYTRLPTGGLTFTTNYIGRSNWSSDSSYEGKIRYVRMFSGALTPAQMPAVSYKTVTFDVNGGTATGVTSATTSGALRLPTTPNKTGSSFNGWYNASSGGTRYGSASGSYTPNATGTAYAQWSLNTYTITLNAGTTGTGSNQTLTKTYGSDLTLPNSASANTYFTRAGYTVSGWSTSNGGSQAYALGGAYSTESATTLYPVWTANTNNVVYDELGGTSVTDGSWTTGGSISSGPTNSTLSGFRLAGWSTTNGGSALTFPYFPSATSDIMLYAVWVPLQTVTSGTCSADVDSTTDVVLTKSGGYCFLTFNNSLAAGNNRTNYWTYPAGLSSADVLVVAGGGGGGGGKMTSGAVGAVGGGGGGGGGEIRKYTNYSLSGIGASITVGGGGTAGASTGTNGTSGNASSFASITSAAGGGGKGGATSGSRSGIGGTGGSGGTATAGKNGGTGATTTSGSSMYGTNGTAAASITLTSQTYCLSGGGGGANTVVSGSNAASIRYGGGCGGTYVGGYGHYGNNNYLGGTAGTANTGSGGGGGGFVNSNARAGAAGGSGIVVVSWATTNTVTFKSNYTAGPSDTTQTITTAVATALAANTFTRADYTFSGWTTNADGSGTSYADGASVTIAGDQTLYAKWVSNTFTVTYNVNGATGTPEKTSEDYLPNSPALSLSTRGTMENVGYKFDGWYTAASGGSLVGLASALYTPTANITLYARWTAETYRINYDSNGGGNNPAYDTYTTGSSPVQLKTQGSLARLGYTFNGWSTTINDLTTKIANSESSATLTATARVQLYALWTADDYQVVYSAGQDATSGSAPSDSLQYNIGQSATIKGSATLVRTGYTFGGWTDSSSTYQSGSTYTFGAASVTLTPVWDPITYNISYNTNGATTGSPARTSDTYTSGTNGLSLPNVGTMARTGYEFSGWSTSPTGTPHSGTFTTTSDVTLYAIWTIKRIAYSYERGTIDSTTLSNLEVATFPAAPSPPYPLYGSTLTLSSTISSTITVNSSGYKFFGWYDGSVTYSPGSTVVMPDAVKTYTAQWAKLYAVRYVLNGGTGVAAADDECNEPGYACLANEPITLSGTPTRDGYTFDGWKDQSNTNFAAGAAFTVTDSSFLLYAQWTPIEYDISFNASGGSVSPGIQNKFIGDSVTLPSPGTRTGYDFDGWTLGGITYGVGTTFTVGASDAVFTALWTAKRYNISFDWNSGVGTSTQSPIFTYGDQPIVLPSGTRDGYVFDGWSTSLNGSAISSPHTPTSDTTYYARWVDGQYTITYNAVGGTVTRPSDSVARASAITLPSATRTGYTFDGWYTDSATTLSYGQANASIVPGQSQTLYAKWTQNSLAGINPAHLTNLMTTTYNGNRVQWSDTHTASGTGVALEIPAGALDVGTVVKVSYVEDLTRPKNIIDNRFAYYASVVLHWQQGTGANATVPTAAAGKPLVLTISNPDIRSGAKIYSIIQGVATEVATATQDGEVDIEIYDDPEIVVAAVTPTAPLSVSATGNQNAQSTVSWSAPASSGGSEVTSYIVTASPGGATCTATGTTSCTVTGLNNDTTYTFTVTATNAIGTSSASTSSSGAIPRLYPTFTASFNSKGGSSLSDVSFTQPGTISEPVAPTRSGYTFAGWLSVDGNASSAVTWPYSPGVNSDITLYASWTPDAVVTPSPTQTPSPSSSATPTPSPTPSNSASATPSPSASRSASATPSTSPSASPSASPSISATPSDSATPTPSPTDSVVPIPMPTDIPLGGAAAEWGGTGVTDTSTGLEIIDPSSQPAAVAQTAVAVMAVVGTVAAAAAGAAAAGAAAGSAAGSSAAAGPRRVETSTSNAPAASDSESSDEQGSLSTVDINQHGFDREHRAWGDALPMWRKRFFTWFDALSTKLTLQVAPLSPLSAKIMNDGAYLRAIIGTLTIVFAVTAGFFGLIGGLANDGKILPPPTAIYLLIAVLGVFDALIGLVGMSVFTLVALASGNVNTASEVRMLLGVLIVGFVPGLITVGFRHIRREPETEFSYVWERITDFAVAPFFAGWSTMAMIGTLPALAGLALPIADQASAFGLFIAIAMVLRVALEEVAARFYPERLNYLHPTEIPGSSDRQKLGALVVRAAAFWFVGLPFIGMCWQLFVGAALFILPNLIGIYAEHIPYSNRIRVSMPQGVPALIVNLLGSMLVVLALTKTMGDSTNLGKITFILLPMFSVLMALLNVWMQDPQESKWYTKNDRQWIYRLGGVVMLLVALRITGII